MTRLMRSHWHFLRLFFGVLALVELALALAIPVYGGGERRLVVSPEGPYTTIRAALVEARDGDIVEVRGGIYQAPVNIDKSVAVIGAGYPVIDGGGVGSLITITAPDVTFEGFILRNSGTALNREDTGIIIQAPRAIVANNVLENVLFGIYFADASNGLARNNTIQGWDLEPGMRGDGIRIWYSDQVIIEGNTIFNVRDTLIWYANNVTITQNHFHNNRYGLHFMYSSNANITHNTFEENSVGTYLMYSDGLSMHSNVIAYNRGPSGYGLALKDMDDVVVSDNIFVGNRTGLFIDNSPFSVDHINLFSGNFFAYNDIGVAAMPATERNVFRANSFLENIQQASTHGRGDLSGNMWHQDGQGNYWSDYVGYDLDGDGIGEMPYRVEELFESLTDEYPALRLFTYSPAAQALDFAAAAFPSLRPQPKLVDEAPMIRYQLPEGLISTDTQASWPFLAGSLALLGLGIGAGSAAFGRPRIARLGGVRAAQHTTPTSTVQALTGKPK